MSSKGVRAAGTDGSDFRHRQKVAHQYAESVKYKKWFSLALFIHLGLFSLLFLKLLEEILDLFGIDWSVLDERLGLEYPYFWEWWWSSSLFVAPSATAAVAKNNAARLQNVYKVIFFLGVLPLCVGAGHLLPELVHFARTGEGERFGGAAVVVLWFLFFAFTLQVHAAELYAARRLIRSWTPLKTDKPQGRLFNVSDSEADPDHAPIDNHSRSKED